MLVPINWMKEYVDINIDEKTLADRLTMTGSHVDSIIDNDKEVEKVVTGKILEVEKHPNADKLVVCKVDVGGEEPLQIITGASNVHPDDVVPVALIDAVLPGGVKLKKTNFRGLPSYGMMVSYEEFGFDEKVIPKDMRDGIAQLDKDIKPGLDVKKVMGLSGKTLDVEVTFNRPDCLNIVGMAREAAATFNAKFKFPDIKIEREDGDIKEYFQAVKIEDEDLCSRFYAKVIKDIKLGQSPLWMQRSLMDAGMRPINNIVDVTNYVMLELGQPLHAYDCESLRGGKLVARRAKEGEKIQTLDMTERTLSGDMLVIADAERAACIAGVMGGYETEINDNTRIMVLESANFNPKSVRETSKKLGLRSEASARNEKIMNYMMCEIASKRACQLIEQIGAGTVVGGELQAGKSTYEAPVVTLRPYRANDLLGTNIPAEEMLKYLNALYLESSYDGEKISCKIPYFRSDIEQEADLVEEVGRMYGLENIVSAHLKGSVRSGKKSEKRQVEDALRTLCCGMGLYEINTYSFLSPKAYDRICAAADSPLRQYVKILNPLGEDYSSMRTTLMTNMLDVMQRNAYRGVESAKLFEIGNTFMPRQIPVVEAPVEKSKLCMGMYGKCDFFDIKGVVEGIMARFGIKATYEPVTDDPMFHPGRTAAIYHKKFRIGIIGEISHAVTENYGIGQRAYVGELDVETILRSKNTDWKYEELPKYPAMVRDIAVKVKDEVPVGDILTAIQGVNPFVIESVKLFDVYRGEHIEEGYKSTAFSITYRNKKHTMKDKEMEAIHNKVIETLKKKFDAEQR